MAAALIALGVNCAPGAQAAGDAATAWDSRIARAEQFLWDRMLAKAPELARIGSPAVEWARDESFVELRDGLGDCRRFSIPSGRSREACGAHDAAGKVEGVSEHSVFSADGQLRVYTQGHDLYVSEANATRRLTSDGEMWRSFDPRFARSNPTSQASDSSAPPLLQFIGKTDWLVAERWDFRNVGQVWLARSLQSPRPDVIEQRMAYPGDTALPLPELWLINARSGERRLIAGEGWAYIGNMDVGGGGIAPDPAGRYLYFVRMNRDYTRVQLCRVEVPTGPVEVVLEENSRPYFTVRSPQIVFVGAGREMIWKSDRDGRPRFYLLDTQSKRIVRTLGNGAYTADRVLHVDAAARAAIFSAYGDGGKGDPNYAHLFRVALDSGSAKRLDGEEATHEAQASPSGRYLVDTFSTLAAAPVTVLRESKTGRVITTLAAADVTALTHLGWSPPQRISTEAADRRTQLYGVMWRPFDFDPARRYPVVARVYPGPAHDAIDTRFDPANANAALAQLGFIVVSIGSRGSSSIRDKAFQTYARQQGGVSDYALEDLRCSLEALARSRPWMDLSRLGIVGHSGGGFMAVAAMLHDPDFYRAGVASAGNQDNRIYEMNSSEYYWGDPRVAPLGGPNGYATTIDEASRLSGALLLIHGESDEDVSLAHTMRLVHALAMANKPFDMLIVPGQGHDLTGPNVPLRDYVRRRTWQHLLEHITGGSPR